MQKGCKRNLYDRTKKIAVTDRNIHRFLGKEKYTYQMANIAAEVGIVRGLAWTSVGGDTLQIEVNVMPGKGELMLTGQLGDVMKESASIAYDYVRANAKKFKINQRSLIRRMCIFMFLKGRCQKMGQVLGLL